MLLRYASHTQPDRVQGSQNTLTLTVFLGRSQDNCRRLSIFRRRSGRLCTPRNRGQKEIFRVHPRRALRNCVRTARSIEPSTYSSCLRTFSCSAKPGWSCCQSPSVAVSALIMSRMLHRGMRRKTMREVFSGRPPLCVRTPIVR